MTFLKEHLTGIYEWNASMDKSVYEGTATRRLFNRWNGTQVLFIINNFLIRTGDLSISQGQKAEKLILEKLPLNTMSELSVLQWLQSEDLAQIN